MHWKIAAIISMMLAVFAASAGNDARAQDAPDRIYALGAIPAPDELTSTFPATPTYRAFLPERVDLSRHFPSPGNQGQQGSCVGWAVGYAARAYYSQAAENRSVRNPTNIPSPAYIFNSIRRNLANCEGGSRIYNALDLLKKGSLSLREFPYSANRCAPPSAQQVASATGFRITDWRYVDHTRLDQVKGELAQAHPVIISMRTRRGFHRLRGTRVYDGDNSSIIGFHAMTLTGYDERKQAFRVINSWGNGWGDRGYGWISYDAFRREVREAYTIRVDASPPPIPIVVPIPEPRPAPEPTPSPEPTPVVVGPDGPVTITGLECGHVRIERRGDRLVAAGFVGSIDDMEKLEAQLAEHKIENLTELRPWPQCETLLTLDKELSAGQRPEIIFTMENDQLTRDNLLVFDIRTPTFPGYLHLAYIQADGSVVHLRQSDATTLQTLAPGTTLRLGDGKAGSLRFRISEPFGMEMMLAISSRSPLFTTPRPQVETEREFLTALRRAILSSPDESDSGRLVTANYHALITKDGAVVP